MPIDESKMVQSIYDTLFNSYTQTPPGGLPEGSQEDKMFITFFPGGEPVAVNQYANSQSPSNPEGLPAATENFSRLIDRIPLVKAAFVDSGKKVSDVYETVIEGANAVPQQTSPAMKEAYNEAFDVLNAEGNDFDDDGKPVEVPVDSPLYARYKRKQLAYGDAVSSFMAEFSRYDLTDPKDQRAWSLIGPSKQRIVTTAWEDLQNAQAKKIEDALATLAQSAENQVGRVLADTQERMKRLTKGSVRDPLDSYLPSYATPANWFSRSAAEGWSSLTFSSGSHQLNQSSNYKKFDGGAGFNLGLWRVGGGANYSQEAQHMDSQTDSLKVSFRYARVNFERPWMNSLIFDLPGWVYPPVQEGGISSGNPAITDGTLMTIVPTGFIVVRDLKIEADWSEAERDYIKKNSRYQRTGWLGTFLSQGSLSVRFH